MSDFEKYYDEELRYLNEGGQEFSEAFPERARYLNITALEDRDPYVERLFEGFAFLTGRIRQKLEDDFPEFTQNLMEMVDPAFLRSIPSLAMLQITLRPNMLPASHVIPRGTPFLSNPDKNKTNLCRFQSTQDVTIYPIILENSEIKHDSVFGEGIKLGFQLEGNANLSQLNIPELPIYLHGERSLGYFLHHFFTERIHKVVFECSGITKILGGQELIEPGGFLESESLLPQQDNSFEGSRFLQEFFSFEEKFRFVKIKGLNAIKDNDKSNKFSLTFYFKDPIPEGKRFKVDNFRLFVTPVVNLFATTSEPISLNHKHFEYPCYGDLETKMEIFEVVSVTGIDKNTGAKRPFYKFNEFRHQILSKGVEAEESYWQSRQELKGKNKFQTYITVGSNKKLETQSEEFLMVHILATDGPVPREEVFEKGIINPHPDFPAFCEFSNFTRPTPPIYPPKSDHYLWYVLSHMNMNYRSLCQKGNLKEVLSLYDWTHSAINKKIIDGVMGATTQKRNFMLDSQVVAGAEITLEVRDGTFSEIGELYIFARVVLEFFTQYSSINHLVSLKVQIQPSGKTISLAPREGRCHLI